VEAKITALIRLTEMSRRWGIETGVPYSVEQAPFSTRQTCGTCHDYDEITQGFHFQMGWDVVADDFGTKVGKPWSLSNGFLGRWYPYAFRQLAKKTNAHPEEIDLTVYDFVGFSAPGRGEPPCGACHPGGGGLEFDRDGERYDERLAAEPELAESLDGDYYKSRWDKSGVVEADCLICHLEGYDFGERVNELKQGNYRWAVVAGSRLGFVEGSVRRDREPEVVYHKRLFNEDGSLTLKMSWPPPDDNCMYCHGTSDEKKRGFSWNDIYNPDLHNEQRVSCTACHPAGPEHQIARGRHGVATTAPDRLDTMQGCKDCHLETANFFKGQRVMDLWGTDGSLVTRSIGLFFGCRPLAFMINSFHQRIISPYVGPAIMVIVFLIVLHYHGYGPKRITFDPYSQGIQRFSVIERLIHLFRLLAFVVLGVSGLIMAFNLHMWQQLLFGSPQRLLDFHIGSGVVFIVTTIGRIALWFRDARFAQYDKDWVKKGGGYLGHKGKVPAGRFNAGQKMFYWYTAAFGIVISVSGVMLVFKNTFQLSTVCITSTIHNLIGFFLVAGVLAHAYLGTVANPGTWRVLIDGSVTRGWAEHHHPNWYDALLKAKIVLKKETRSGESTDRDNNA